MADMVWTTSLDDLGQWISKEAFLQSLSKAIRNGGTWWLLPVNQITHQTWHRKLIPAWSRFTSGGTGI